MPTILITVAEKSFSGPMFDEVAQPFAGQPLFDRTTMNTWEDEFAAAPWQPRLGVQLDAASGDRNPDDGCVGTFNPMFPNGYYVTLSGYTGYSHFIHFKPSLTLRPAPGVKVLAAFGALWRKTTHDAVFAQPNLALTRTAGAPGRRTAGYAQLRIDSAVARNIALALEADRYAVARVVREAGGRDSTYVGTEIRWGW